MTRARFRKYSARHRVLHSEVIVSESRFQIIVLWIRLLQVNINLPARIIAVTISVLDCYAFSVFRDRINPPFTIYRRFPLASQWLWGHVCRIGSRVAERELTADVGLGVLNPPIFDLRVHHKVWCWVSVSATGWGCADAATVTCGNMGNIFEDFMSAMLIEVGTDLHVFSKYYSHITEV